MQKNTGRLTIETGLGPEDRMDEVDSPEARRRDKTIFARPYSRVKKPVKVREDSPMLKSPVFDPTNPTRYKRTRRAAFGSDSSPSESDLDSSDNYLSRSRDSLSSNEAELAAAAAPTARRQVPRNPRRMSGRGGGGGGAQATAEADGGGAQATGEADGGEDAQRIADEELLQRGWGSPMSEGTFNKMTAASSRQMARLASEEPLNASAASSAGDSSTYSEEMNALLAAIGTPPQPQQPGPAPDGDETPRTGEGGGGDRRHSFKSPWSANCCQHFLSHSNKSQL